MKVWKHDIVTVSSVRKCLFLLNLRKLEKTDFYSSVLKWRDILLCSMSVYALSAMEKR